MLSALADFPQIVDLFLNEHQRVEANEIKLNEVISGFFDADAANNPPPNASSL